MVFCQYFGQVKSRNNSSLVNLFGQISHRLEVIKNFFRTPHLFHGSLDMGPLHPLDSLVPGGNTSMTRVGFSPPKLYQRGASPYQETFAA